MSVTIYDIAKKCHCSTATVSKALNGAGKISNEKKEEILNAAKELGYVTNQSARSLASSNKNSRLIGVVLHTLEEKSIAHEMFSNILNYFRITLEKNGYDICFLRNINDDDILEYRDFIRARDLDGVFILSADSSEKKIIQLLKEDIPMVAFDVTTAKYQVHSNNTEAVAELVDYLSKMGHQRICYVYPHEYGVSKQRYEGFLLGLERNNIPFDPRMIIKAPFFSHNSAELATDAALKSGYEPTVIMYPDDYTAIHAIPYLRKLGLKVPQNISITGFDGIEIATAVRPSLVTVRQNAKETGIAAGEFLLKLINKEELESPVKVVESTIIYGHSVSEIEK